MLTDVELLPLRKAADAAFGSKAQQFFLPSGQNLMRITLVPDIEYEFILRKMQKAV